MGEYISDRTLHKVLEIFTRAKITEAMSHALVEF